MTDRSAIPDPEPPDAPEPPATASSGRTPDPGPAPTTPLPTPAPEPAPVPAATPPGVPAAPRPPAPPAADPAPPTAGARRGIDPVALVALITGALGLGAIPLSLGIIGRHRAKRSGRDDQGFSTVGIVLGAVSLAAWFVLGTMFVLGLGLHGFEHGRMEARPGIERFDERGPFGFGDGTTERRGGESGTQRVDPRTGPGGAVVCERTAQGTVCRDAEGSDSAPGGLPSELPTRPGDSRGNGATEEPTPSS